MEEASGSAEETPNPSELLEIESLEQRKEEMKNDLTNALKYCQSLLESEDLITNAPSEKVSSASIAMGEEIFKEIVSMLGERKLIIDEELKTFEETDSEGEYDECKDEPSDSPYYDEYQFGEKPDYISLSYKERAVALAEAHPKWSLKTLQKQGCSRLKDKKRLKQWKQDITRGGTMIDKWKHIEMETLAHFKEARECLEQVTTRTLQQWAMAAAFPYLSTNFSFSASSTWVKRFKSKYRIKQRKITKFVSNRDHATLEETLEAVERFQIQTKAIIPDFDLNFVINTDQTGCQYQIVYNSTLTAQGSKTVLVKKKSLNTLTHSYTAQYALTASGKMLPFVFLCMQETTSKFGPIIKKKLIN